MAMQDDAPSLLQTQAYEYVKEKILSNEWQPDTMYSETKLAAEIGISRTPLRQSLHRLSQDGYITIYPSRGFMLRTLTDADMKETIEVRCAIEGFATYCIGNEADEARRQAILSALEEELAAMRQAKSDAEFIEHDHAFHVAVVRFVENAEFNQIFQRLMYLIHLTSTSSLSVPGRRKSTLEEHEAYAVLLRERKAAEAYAALMEHLIMPLRIVHR